MSGSAILLVDDDHEVRNTLSEFLIMAGHDVTVASSGREAIETLRARETPFEVAIVDWQMEGISGREVIQEIRRETPETNILISTGHTEAEVPASVAEKLAHGVLRKPFSLRRLLAVVEGITVKSPASSRAETASPAARAK